MKFKFNELIEHKEQITDRKRLRGNPAISVTPASLTIGHSISGMYVIEMAFIKGHCQSHRPSFLVYYKA